MLQDCATATPPTMQTFHTLTNFVFYVNYYFHFCIRNVNCAIIQSMKLLGFFIFHSMPLSIMRPTAAIKKYFWIFSSEKIWLFAHRKMVRYLIWCSHGIAVDRNHSIVVVSNWRWSIKRLKGCHCNVPIEERENIWLITIKKVSDKFSFSKFIFLLWIIWNSINWRINTVKNSITEFSLRRSTIMFIVFPLPHFLSLLNINFFQAHLI